MSDRVKLFDIAAKVGVSATTVTRALNGKAKVSDSVRQRIIATAKDMGYVPNKMAQSLSRNEIKIGVLYSQEPAEFID